MRLPESATDPVSKACCEELDKTITKVREVAGTDLLHALLVVFPLTPNLQMGESLLRLTTSFGNDMDGVAMVISAVARHLNCCLVPMDLFERSRPLEAPTVDVHSDETEWTSSPSPGRKLDD